MRSRPSAVRATALIACASSSIALSMAVEVGGHLLQEATGGFAASARLSVASATPSRTSSFSAVWGAAVILVSSHLVQTGRGSGYPD